MLTRFFSRLRRPAPVTRAAQATRERVLHLEALEAREVPAIIFALNGTTSNQLIRFDSATPTMTTTVAVTNLTAGDTLQGIDFRPRTGQLYGVAFAANSTGSNAARTYTINTTTGVATLVGASAAITNGSDSFAGDIDFNPTVDRIRYVASNGTLSANARLNPNNGAGAGTNNADDAPLAPTSAVIIGAAYDRNFDRQGTTIATTLYAIDRTTGTLGTIGSVNGTPNSPNGGAYTQIGALGFTLATANNNEGGFDIAVSADANANNGGKGVAYAALTAADNVTRLYTINLTTGAATSLGAIGAGTNEIFDIAVVPDNVVVVGSGAGATGDIRILNGNDGTLRRAISNPFPGFQGGVRVAAGDVTGDGVPDAIVAAVFAQGPVKVFDGVTGAQVPGGIGSFFAFVNFQGTVSVGAGDVNGDGYADVLVSADGVRGGHVKAFSGNPATSGQELASFFAYPGASGTASDGFLGNLTVAGADFDNDGRDEIVTVATNNGHVKVFSLTFTTGVTTGTAGAFASAVAPALSSFFAFPGFTTGPVNVAAGDVTGDGFADIVVSSGAGTPGHVKVFSGRVNPNSQTNPTNPVLSFFSLPNTTVGASVGLADANNDGLLDIRITPGAGAAAQLFTFDITGTAIGTGVTTFAGFNGGSTVAGARF